MQNKMQSLAQTQNEQQVQLLQTTKLLGQTFTVYGTPSEPLFKAKDVALMLGLSNQREFVNRVDDEERCKLNLPRQGETWFLTEYGLYEVLMQSRKPIAKEFKRGIKTLLRTLRLGTAQALPMAENLHGVAPIIYEGHAWYYLRNVLSSLGMSRHSGTAGRYALRYPSEVARINGRLYCSLKLGKLISYRHEVRLREQSLIASIQLPFNA